MSETLEPGTPEKPRRGRAARWLRIVAVAALLLLAIRAVLPFVAFRVARSVLAGSGLALDWEDLDLSLSRGRAALTGVTLAPSGATEPAVRLAFAEIDVRLATLVSGRFVVENLELDGLEIALESDASGAFPLLDGFATDASAGEPAAGAEPAAAAPAGRVSLRLPLEIERLRIQPLRVSLEDRSAIPPVALSAEVTVRGDRLGSLQEEARLAVRARSPECLSSLTIDATARGGEDSLEGGAAIDAESIRLAPLAPYLRQLGLEPLAEASSFRCALRLSARAVPERGGALEGELSLSDAAFVADGETAFSLAVAKASISSLLPSEIAVAVAEASGLRARAGRAADGRLAVLGVLVGGAPGDGPTTAPGPAAAASDGGAPFSWSVARAAVGDAEFRFTDATVAGSPVLAALLDSLTVENAADPARGPASDEPWKLAAALRLADGIESIRVEGTLAPLGARRRASLSVVADGISARSLVPHLRAAGLEPVLENGSLRIGIAASAETDSAGTTHADLRVEPFELRDGPGRELASLARATASGIEFATDSDRAGLVVGEVSIAGPSLPLRRVSSGAFEALGIRTIAPSPSPASPRSSPAPRAAAPPAAAPESSPIFPAIAIGRFAWEAGAVTFTDETASPPIELRLASATAEIAGLAAGAEPANVLFHASVADVAESIDVAARLSIAPDRSSLRCEGTLASAGVTARALGPRLRSAGIDVAGLDAASRARFDASLSRGDAGDVALAASLTDTGFSQAGEDVVTLASLAVSDARFGPLGTRIGAIEGGVAAVRLARDADGALRIGGVRIPSRGESAPAAAAAGEPPSAEPPPAAAPATSFAIDRIGLESLAIEWSDALAGTAEPVPLSASIGGHVEGVRLGARGLEAPAQFSVAIAAPGVAESIVFRGTANFANGGAEAAFRAEGTGLRPGALSPYLPPGISSAVADGRLRAEVAASAGPATDGGFRVEFAATALDWREAGADDPLFAFDRLALRAPRVDPRAGGAILVEEMSLTGLAAEVFRHASGGSTIGGLRFEPPAAAAPAPPADPGEPGTGAAPRPASPTPAPLPPRVSVERFEIGLARLSLDAEGREPGAPPIVASLGLAAVEPIDLFAPGDDVAAESVVLRLDGSAPSLFESARIDLSLDPFEDRPSADVTVLVSGIDGSGLAALAPGLAGRIDAAGLDSGEFRARARAELVFPRRGPLDFTLRDGFGAELDVSECDLRSAPGGPVLAGVDELEVVLQRYSPRTGDVHVRSIRVETPRGSVVREEAGFRAMGLLFKPPPAAAADAPSPDTGVPVPSPEAAPRAPEFRVDSVQSSGVEFSFTDSTVSPPLVVPVSELDVDVRGYSTRAAETNRAVSFSLSASAGPSALPNGERRAFDEIAVSGRVVPSAEPTGYVRMNVSALELMCLAAEASRSGVTIGGGVLDASAAIRFKGKKGTAVESRLVFDSLSLEEGADGPISRILKLPASLDTVLFLLRDANEQQQFTFDFEVPPGGIGTGRVLTHALAKLSEAIAKAVANSPFRVTGVVTNLLGVTGGEPDLPLPTVSAEFAPGDAALGPAQRESLAEIVERLDDDGEVTVVLRHEIGKDDWAMAEERANPPASTAAEIATRLRRQRAALSREQAEGAALVRTLFAAGRGEEAEKAAASVREIEERAGECEAALESVLSLLSPRADRRRAQRTRAACVDLGDARLRAVRDALLASGVSEIEERVTVRPARGGPVLESGPGRVALIERRRPAEPGLWDKIIETLMFWTWI